jgi:hypothetical protein
MTALLLTGKDNELVFWLVDFGFPFVFGFSDV